MMLTGTPVREAQIAREEGRSVLGRIIVVDRGGEAPAAEFEGRRVLQEEIARLRLEQVEPRGVDLEKIQRAVGKIRIDGQRAGQLRRDLVEGVAGEPRALGLALRLCQSKR